MVKSCNVTEEGRAAYAKLGRPYPMEIDDQMYEDYLKDTHVEGLPKGVKEKSYLRFTRIKPYSDQEDSPDKDKEFLVYGFEHSRIDESGNIKQWYRSRVGLWSDPNPMWGVKDKDATRKERYLVEILDHTERYTIPWNKETKDWLKTLKKNGEFHPKVAFTVYRVNNFSGPKRIFTVLTFANFLDGSFEDLESYGRIIKSDAEKKELDKQITEAQARIAIRGY